VRGRIAGAVHVEQTACRTRETSVTTAGAGAVEQELRRALDHTVLRLGELVGESHGFVETVAHDLRAPLAAMSGFAELVAQDEDLTVVSRQLLHRIVVSARNAADRVESVLEQARVRSEELREGVELAHAEGLRQVLLALETDGPVTITRRAVEADPAGWELCVEGPDGDAVTFPLSATT
jgi:signal transduction histidine kinase